MTKLNHWFDMVNEGETHPTYTRDSWVIPEEGAKIWCSGWKNSKIIKPYGEGCHVYVNSSVYHCDELVEILNEWKKDGHTWGIEGVEMVRNQNINGEWIPVKIQEVAI